MRVADDNILRETLFAFFSHLRLFKQVVPLSALVTLAVAFLLPPTYDIGGTLQVESKKVASPPDVLSNSPDYRQVIPPTAQDVETEATLLQSPEFLKYAAREMQAAGIEPASGLFGTYVAEPLRKLKDSALVFLGLKEEGEDDTLWKGLAKSMEVNSFPGTTIVEVHYFSRFPEDDLKIANMLMQAYLVFRVTPNTSEPPLQFYESKKEEFRRRYADLHRRKTSLLKDTALAGTPAEEIERLTSQSTIMQTELKDLREKRSSGFQWLKYVLDMTVAMEKQRTKTSAMTPFPMTFDSIDTREINNKLFDLLVEYIKASSTFSPNFSGARASRESLRAMEEYILQMAANEVALRETQIRVMDEQIAERENELERTKNTIALLKQVLPELTLLDAELLSLETALQTFSRKSEESNLQTLAGQVQLSNVRIASAASLPEHPYFPRKRYVLPIGLLGGVLLGLVAVFSKHFFSRTFSTPEQASAILGLPVIGSIPEAGTARPRVSDIWNFRGIFSRPVAPPLPPPPARQ